MSYEMIATLMFASMMVLLMTGQRVFAAIGFVAAGAALYLFKQSGVRDSGGQLVGQSLQNCHVVLGESGLSGRLDVQYPDHPILYFERQRHFREGIGEISVGKRG